VAYLSELEILNTTFYIAVILIVWKRGSWNIFGSK